MGPKAWLTSADQLVQFVNFISATAALGAETTKIQMGFQSYFNRFVEKNITDPVLREYLRKIPADIRIELDPEGNKKISLEIYQAAIVQLLLNQLIQHQTKQLFMKKKIEDNEARLKVILKKMRLEKEDRIAAQDYVKVIMEQNRVLELMAAVAFSLSMRKMDNRIDSLEKSQYKIFNELVEEFHKTLEAGEEFKSLTDSQGNTVFKDKASKKDMLSSVLTQYTDDFVDYCSQQNAIPFEDRFFENGAQRITPDLGLTAYQQRNNDLFERFHHETPNRFHSIVANHLKNKNIDIYKHELHVSTLGAKMHAGIAVTNQRKRLVELAVKRIEIKNAKANLEGMRQTLDQNNGETKKLMDLF